MWRNTKLPQGDPAVHLQAALKNTGSLWLQQPPPRLCIPGHHHLHGSFLHSALTWGGRGTCPTIPLRLNSAYTVQILGCRKGQLSRREQNGVCSVTQTHQDLSASVFVSCFILKLSESDRCECWLMALQLSNYLSFPPAQEFVLAKRGWAAFKKRKICHY